MPRTIDLGDMDQVVDKLVDSGRFGSDDEVLREGVRLIEREERRAELLRAIDVGLAEADAGQGMDAFEFLDQARHRFGFSD